MPSLLLIIAACVLAVLGIIALVWLAGYVRALTEHDRMVTKTRRPKIHIVSATTQVSPGDRATVHVSITDAERCWIDWSPGSNSARAKGKRNGTVRDARTGEVAWTRKIAEKARPGLRTVKVTAEGQWGRSSAIVPIRVAAANGKRRPTRSYVSKKATARATDAN